MTSKHAIDAIIMWPQRSESIRSRLRAGSGVTNCREGEGRLLIFVFYERVGKRTTQGQAHWTANPQGEFFRRSRHHESLHPFNSYINCG